MSAVQIEQPDELPLCLGDGCGRRLVTQAAWRALSNEERRAQRAQGLAGRQGRGLCLTCYTRLRRTGGLIDFERPNRSRAEVLEEWRALPTEGSTNERIRQLAPRLGMTVDALSRAICRATARGEL